LIELVIPLFPFELRLQGGNELRRDLSVLVEPSLNTASSSFLVVVGYAASGTVIAVGSNGRNAVRCVRRSNRGEI
jgi:hypothetical protein